MTDETLPFPFRFPEPGEDTTHAGLCQECVNAPIVQTPCPHTTAIIPFVKHAEKPVEDEEGSGIRAARPAVNEPSERGECEVCGMWAVEHKDENHPYTPTGRKPKFIVGAKR